MYVYICLYIYLTSSRSSRRHTAAGGSKYHASGARGGGEEEEEEEEEEGGGGFSHRSRSHLDRNTACLADMFEDVQGVEIAAASYIYICI
jgi:hypothetical protein